MEAIDVFHPSRMADRILGMGDVVSLVERAQEQYDEEIFSNEEDEQNVDLEQGGLLVQEKIETNQVLHIVDGLISRTTTKRKGLKYLLVPDPEHC